ncbi:hypothetical protein B0H13DRAFT_1876372 [Mycena leptocephala]|nr:hypothetical protein B0H13DRAFT_1876372 [Mycena leptocephala]
MGCALEDSGRCITGHKGVVGRAVDSKWDWVIFSELPHSRNSGKPQAASLTRVLGSIRSMWKIAMYHPKRCKKLPLNPREHETREKNEPRDIEKQNKKRMNVSHLNPTPHELGGQNQHELKTRQITQWRSVELHDEDTSNSTFTHCGSDEPPPTFIPARMKEVNKQETSQVH